MGRLLNLEELYLNNIRLSGPLPPELGRLARPEIVDLSGNDLAGRAPSGDSRGGSVRRTSGRPTVETTCSKGSAIPRRLSAGEQLEFVLKHDGTNLAILARLFRVVPEDELLAYVRFRPTGKYARRLWFLYEFLTDRRLPLDDLKQGNYVDMLEPDAYCTIGPARRSRRHRVDDNLLGDRRFCPTIRRTDVLRGFETADLPSRWRRIAARYAPELLRRALGYLYARETKSSLAIEHVTPTSTRAERFAALLRLAHREDFCDRPRLVELQNRIVDARFRDADCRRTQNYVGETVGWRSERVHFVAPRPEDLGDLMEGLVAAHRRMASGNAPAVIHAAAVAWGFVFLHPFEDGNGRIHRFLIHNILARRGFTPAGVMAPVSATMLKHAADYDASLEAFARRLMPLVEYTLDDDGRLTVHNDTALWYRYIRHDGPGGSALPLPGPDHRYRAGRRAGVPDPVRRGQAGDSGDRGHARPPDRSLHSLVPPERRPSPGTETREALRPSVG